MRLIDDMLAEAERLNKLEGDFLLVESARSTAIALRRAAEQLEDAWRREGEADSQAREA